jgi:hypothetical protein
MSKKKSKMAANINEINMNRRILFRAFACLAEALVASPKESGVQGIGAAVGGCAFSLAFCLLYAVYCILSLPSIPTFQYSVLCTF